MKTFINKNKKIIINMMYLIISISVLFTFLVTVEFHKQKNTKAVSVQSNSNGNDERTISDDEITGEEINISELENFTQENTIQENSTIPTSKSNPTSKTSSSKKANNTNTTNIVPYSKGYYIKVNYGANVVTIYTNDSSGNFTVPVKAMVCSTGRATPKSGTYTIKSRWEWLGLIGGVYGHYSTQIVGNILFHSVPYLRKYDPASLEYWEYDKLGTSASAGCIRLTIADAKWIYNNIPRGTIVEFYSSGDPGPFRKTFCTKNFW